MSGRRTSTRERLPISRISHSHSPDKRGERRDKWARQPIDVKPCGSGYRVIDGNDRLYYARQRGDTHIDALVWRTTTEQAKPAKRRGLLYWE
jgi:hypothetical protein